MSDFFRFPHTPHIDWLGEGMPRDDKVLNNAEVEAILAQPLRIEEKLDGANLGISMRASGELRAQNRGQYLLEPYAGQFSRLTSSRPVFIRTLCRAVLAFDFLAGSASLCFV